MADTTTGYPDQTEDTAPLCCPACGCADAVKRRGAEAPHPQHGDVTAETPGVVVGRSRKKAVPTGLARPSSRRPPATPKLNFRGGVFDGIERER